MEIVCLEVSTQKHINQMQETVKVNYVQYGKGAKGKKCKPKKSGNSGCAVAAVLMLKNAMAAMQVLVKPNPKARNPHYLPTSAGGVEKQDTRKARSAKALESTCRNCGIKGHCMRRCT